MTFIELAINVYVASLILSVVTIGVAAAMIGTKVSPDAFFLLIVSIVPFANTAFVLAVAFRKVPLSMLSSAMRKMTPEEEDGFVPMPIKNCTTIFQQKL
jgi:hypothetical protein